MNTTIQQVFSVEVDGRDDGTYVFGNATDADNFVDAVRDAGGDAHRTTQTLIDHNGTARLIEAELDES